MAWTKEEVLLNKNNMAIAKFMGAEILSPDSKFSYVQYPMEAWVTDVGSHKETYKQKLHSKQLEYHESWNWIMPVVDKIESLGYYLNWTGKTDYVVFTTGIDGIAVVNLRGKESGFSKVETIYQVVLKFIDWYNT